MASAKSQVKRKLNGLHTATKTAMVLSLLVGLVLGAVACYVISRNDAFTLKGNTEIQCDPGSEGGVFLYTDEGATVTCFGRDMSDKIKAESDLERDSEGRYIIPVDRPGVYTIVYTVDCVKFGTVKPIERIRVFRVGAKEGTNG